MNNMSPKFFEPDKTYEIHASGFNEPIVGKIVDSKVSEGDILLVIKKSDDSQPINVFMKAITGWRIIDDKRIAPAA